MKKTMILLGCLLFGHFFKSNAQACVYFDRQTSAMGYSYGAYDACDRAYESCRLYGGPNPVLVVSTNNKGYGAIAFGTDAYGRREVGASVANSTLSEAIDNAKAELYSIGADNVYIYTYWDDGSY